MRIASFNVENLFARAVALNQDQWTSDQGENPSRWAAGREMLETYANGTLWPHVSEMTRASQEVSDHAAIWADLDLLPPRSHS